MNPTASHKQRLSFPRFTRPRSLAGKRSRIRVPELALGVGLVAAGALGSVFWATRAPSQRVVVAAKPLHRGDVLDGQSVRWAAISGDHIVGISNPRDLAGRVVAGEVPVGTPLQISMLESSDSIGPNEVEVGLALEPGDFPPGLATGDAVSVVVVAGGEPGAAASSTFTLTSPARVSAVEKPDIRSGSRTVVSLIINSSDVSAIASGAHIGLARLPERDHASPNAGTPNAETPDTAPSRSGSQ